MEREEKERKREGVRETSRDREEKDECACMKDPNL
jgi:hypothetical protein